MELTENAVFGALGLEAPSDQPPAPEGQAPEEQTGDPAQARQSGTHEETGELSPQDGSEDSEVHADEGGSIEARRGESDPAPIPDWVLEARRQAAEQAARDQAVRQAYEQARRQAYEEARAAQAEELRQFFAQAGLTDPYSGAPISTLEEYRTFAARENAERVSRELAEGKLTMEGLESIVRKVLEEREAPSGRLRGQKGAPIGTQRSGFDGERSRSEASEPCRLRRGEGYAACGDEDWSEGENPAAAKRGRIMPETEGKQPSDQPPERRDSGEAPKAREQGTKAGAAGKAQGGGAGPEWVFPESEGAVCQWHTSSADRAEGETLGPAAEGLRRDSGEAPSAQPPADDPRIAAEIAEIGRMDPAIREMGDLLRQPWSRDFYQAVQEGYSFLGAYHKAASGQQARQAAAAARQKAIDQVNSKAHLTASAAPQGGGMESVPPEDMKYFRLFMPDASEAEIQKYYNQSKR